MPIPRNPPTWSLVRLRTTIAPRLSFGQLRFYAEPSSRPTISRPTISHQFPPPRTRKPSYSKPDREPNYSKPDRGPKYSKPDRQPKYSKPDREPRYSKSDREPKYSKPDHESKSADAAATPDPTPAYAFINGQRVLVTGNSVRQRMAQKEKRLHEERERATTPNTVTSDIAPIMAPDLSAPEDMEDGMGMFGVGSEGADGFAGYQRIQRGDLCELRGLSNVEMGIYLRDTVGEPTGDFLAPHGMVKKMFTARVGFTIPGFVSPDAINKFVDYYKKVEQFELQRGKTIDQESAISSRGVSTPILMPVREFQLEARRLQSMHFSQLEGLYNRLAGERETRAVTTREAAELVFGENPTNEQIYATHLTMMGDGLRYIGDRGFHRITSRFRVRSKQDLEIVDSVTRWLRASSAVFDSKGQGPKAGGPLKDFINKAKFLIDLSRNLRASKPEQPSASVERVEMPDMEWTESDRMFIEFLKARLKAYGLQPTPIEGLVPYILRQTGKYNQEKLDGSCTYDFLVEIGAFSPWENMTLHQENQSIPEYCGSKQVDAEEARIKTINKTPFEDLQLVDSLASIRKDWGDQKVFCVDDITAQEIDDGFSVEKISPDQSWIHVHIANPTAFLTPDHWISQIAANRATTKYLDPHVFRMLPMPISEALGVSPGAPVFTFSTKIDTNTGEILDYEVQPGTVHNVRRITYDQLADTLGMTQVEKLIISVGQPATAAAVEKTPEAPNLSPDDIETLRHLQKCYLALSRRRVRNGMIALRNVIYNYKISPEAAELSNSSDLYSPMPIVYRGFPSITLSVDKQPEFLGAQDLVAEFMILANTTIALYAQKHNLPMPFRALEYNSERPDIIEKFTKEIMPTRDEYGVASRSIIDDLHVYLTIGFSRLLVDPAPHRLLGLPQGYVKATSPLRRYSDMIAHWNLQAHLLSQPLPFPKSRLVGLLADVDLKERMANFGTNETRRFWMTACMQRLLADPAGVKQQLPQRMTMTLTETKMWPTPSIGFVQELAVMAKVMFSGIKHQAGLKIGDKIVVRPLEARMGERVVLFEAQGKTTEGGSGLVRKLVTRN